MKKNPMLTKFYLLILIVTLWSGINFTLPDFIDNPVNGFRGFLIAGLHWSSVCFVCFFFIYLISINKYIFCVFLPVYFVIGSLVGFFRYSFKATLTPMIVDAAFNNDLGTSLDLISGNLVFFVILNTIISLLFVRYRLKSIKLNNSLLHFLLSLIILVIPFLISDRFKSSINQRFPFNVGYSFYQYFDMNKSINFERIDFEPDFNCHEISASDSLLVVFVIGESARADHFSLNGYYRKTNPKLEKRHGIFSFPYVFSEYTYTNRSLPHIFTRADSININRAFEEKSFISLFEKCDFRTEWISNQDPAGSYINIMKECDSIIYAHPEKSVYNYNEWLDEDLLQFVILNQSKSYNKNLLILHTIGSHWYYNNHFKRNENNFFPVTKSRIINQNTPEEIINSYDNTIIYTDYFLDSLISIIQNQNSVLIYLSDHGEALGEDGQWLHANNHDVSKNPACLIWLSDRFLNDNPDIIKILNENRLKRWRTDFIFHSILSISKIPSKKIEYSLDVFSIQ